KDCVYRLYDVFAAARELSRQEGEGIEMIGLNPKAVPVLDSTFTFLVSRNRGICRDERMLNTGCKVGIMLNESLKYLQVLNVDMVEVRFNALLIFGALLSTLFLVEVERGAMSLDEEDEVYIEKLKEFLQGVSTNLVDSVEALPLDSIVRVSFLEGASSEGHILH
ncbi:MAG: hypothetical protein ACYCZ7_01000, partial [Minisyncoccota bacterium]